MKTKTLIGGLALIAAVGTGVTNMGQTKRACEIYQGRNTIDQSPTNYVFDPVIYQLREGRYPLSIEGDEDLVGQLEIGRKYCFEYTTPLIGQNKRLRNIEAQ